MFYRYSKLCIVNPHLFEASGSIDHYFRTGVNDKQHVGTHKHVVPSITLQLAFKFNLLDRTLNTLDLTEKKHQIMLEWVLKKHSTTLNFLLQNGMVYKYQDLLRMFRDGEFEGITGGATKVSFLEYEYGIPS